MNKTFIGDPEAHKQIQQQEAQFREQQNWASNRVKPWSERVINGNLRREDYDFRDWAKDASKNCLHAGAAYEYARESRKMRGLLVLMNPKRPRNDWEIMGPASIDGRRPKPGEIESYPAEALRLPCSFEGLDEHETERALGGVLYCLCDLADHLADNISFGELFSTRRDELEKAFGGLDKLSRVKREFRYFLPIDEALDIASQSGAECATVEETVSNEQRRIILGESCSEVVAIQIRWRFTDSQIVTALKTFLRAHRPRSEAYNPSQRKKGSRRDSVQSALDCLSAMRLSSFLPKTAPPPTPGKFAAWKSGTAAELKESAIDLFNTVRLGGRGGRIAESNFDNLITEASEVFRKSFPFGEDAANAIRLKDRVMMRSERISSQDKV